MKISRRFFVKSLSTAVPTLSLGPGFFLTSRKAPPTQAPAKRSASKQALIDFFKSSDEQLSRMLGNSDVATANSPGMLMFQKQHPLYTINPKFWGRELDWSGVIWNDGKAGVLITDQVVANCWHVRYGKKQADSKKKLKFVAGKGGRKNITQRSPLTTKRIAGTDIALTKLNKPVDTTKHSVYPILAPVRKADTPTPEEQRMLCIGCSFKAPGKPHRIRAQVRQIRSTTNRAGLSGPTMIMGSTRDPKLGPFIGYIVGDSGLPTFLLGPNRQLILAETHTTTTGGPNYSHFIQEINNVIRREFRLNQKVKVYQWNR